MISLLPTMHIMRWVLALVAVVVSGLFGHHLGAQREREVIAIEVLEQEANLAGIEQQYQFQAAQLRNQRDIADASNSSLQKTLKQLQKKSLEQESTQRLYDNIEGKDRSFGLSVDTVTRVNGDNGKLKELQITVVQARGRNRVKGQIGIALVGEKAGSEWREVIVDAASDSALRFDMRFFQTLVLPLTAEESHIKIVEIDIKPDGKPHKPVSYAIDWSSILED